MKYFSASENVHILFFPFQLIICSFLCILCVSGSVLAETPNAFKLQSGNEQQWYRGNMHTHSHWSDGDDYLDNIALWYRDHGYQFLVFTDHNVLANSMKWVDIEKTKGGQKAFDKLIKNFPEQTETRDQDGSKQVRLQTYAEIAKRFNDPGKYLLIQGEEISDRFEKFPIHLNVSNVKELVRPRGGESVAETIQNNVNAIVTQRERTGQPMFIHLNHPNFGYAVTAEDLMRVVGDKFFEVYNGHPGVHNSGDDQHASTERIWDIVLTRRLAEFDLPAMYGIAVDDGHNYHNIPSRASEPGRGWVVVLANELSPASLIESLESGRFYASNGVAIQKIESTQQKLTIEIDAVDGELYTTEFIGTRIGYDSTSMPVLDKEGQPLLLTRRYSKDIGEVLKTVQGITAEYEYAGDEIYVRARVTSDAKHSNPSELGDLKSAWIQPVVLEGSNADTQ
ncbi:MAG TPA: hypothetical protein DD473_28500 [Planctomycetaceae bacterium]|nr:hypothetical protein [Planctomycetaceae bacterium]